MTDTVPYHCDFENMVERAYWRLSNTTSVGGNKWMIGSATHYGSGQYSLYISNNDTNYQHSTVLSVSYATRKIHMPIGIYEVSYDWQSLGTLNADYMRVFLMPDSPTLTITGGSLMQGLTLRVYYKKNISKREDFWDPSLNNDPDGTYYYHFTAKGYLGHVQRNGVIQVVR